MFLVTLSHKVMKRNKITPNERLCKFSSRSHRVDLVELQDQITFVVNVVHDGGYLQDRFKVNNTPAVLSECKLRQGRELFFMKQRKTTHRTVE